MRTLAGTLVALALSSGAGCSGDREADVERATASTVSTPPWRAGKVFRDCTECPEMVVLPNGVDAIGRYEVTLGEYRAFVAATGEGAGGGCNGGGESDSWRNPGFPQTDRHPVTCMNWGDARAYVSWLNRQTRAIYRLPTWSDWGWLNWVDRGPEGCDLAERPDGRTCPVGIYDADSRVDVWGTDGNVWEWTFGPREESLGPARWLIGGSPDVSKRVDYAGRRHSDTGFRVFATTNPPTVEANLDLDRRTRRLIQHGLLSEGLEPGPPNGLLGPPARAAIREWQASRGGRVTGYLTWEEAELLRLAGAARR